MLIRPYVPEDAGRLARIYHDAVQIGSAGHYTQAQRDDWSASCPTADGYRARLEGLTTFVAEEGAPVGFMSVRDADGYIDLAFVVPERIGTGVAHALYRHVLAHFRRLGLARMTVEASAQSHVFFLRQGWSVTGRKPHGEGAARIETWLMDKALQSADADRHD